MRKRQSCESAPPRIAKREPLEDDIQSHRNDPNSILIARVLQLREDGNKDWRIANIIGEETGKGPRSVEGQMRKLIKAGDLPQNPNKQKKVSGKKTFLIEKRNELVGVGMCDGAIAKIISDETGKTTGSVKQQYLLMLEKGY